MYGGPSQQQTYPQQQAGGWQGASNTGRGGGAGGPGGRGRGGPSGGWGGRGRGAPSGGGGGNDRGGMTRGRGAPTRGGQGAARGQYGTQQNQYGNSSQTYQGNNPGMDYGRGRGDVSMNRSQGQDDYTNDQDWSSEYNSGGGGQYDPSSIRIGDGGSSFREKLNSFFSQPKPGPGYGGNQDEAGYNQGQGGYNQGQGGYNQGQGGYNQAQSGYNRGRGGYNQTQGYNNRGQGYNRGGSSYTQQEDMFDAYGGGTQKNQDNYETEDMDTDTKDGQQETGSDKRQGGPYAAHYAKGPSINPAALKASQQSQQKYPSPAPGVDKTEEADDEGLDDPDAVHRQSRGLSGFLSALKPPEDSVSGQRGPGLLGKAPDRDQYGPGGSPAGRGPPNRDFGAKGGILGQGPNSRPGPQRDVSQDRGQFSGPKPGPGLLGEGPGNREAGPQGGRGPQNREQYPQRGPQDRGQFQGPQRGSGPGNQYSVQGPRGPQDRGFQGPPRDQNRGPPVGPNGRGPGRDVPPERPPYGQDRYGPNRGPADRPAPKPLMDLHVEPVGDRSGSLERGDYRDPDQMRKFFNDNQRRMERPGYDGPGLDDRRIPERLRDEFDRREPLRPEPRDLYDRNFQERDYNLLAEREFREARLQEEVRRPSIQLEDVMKQLQQQNATPDRQAEIQRQLASLQQERQQALPNNAFLREQQIRIQEQMLRQQLLMEQQRQAQILELQRQQQMLEQQRQEAILQQKQQQLEELQRQQSLLQAQQLQRALQLKQQQEHMAVQKKDEPEQKPKPDEKEEGAKADPGNDDYHCKVCQVKIKGLMAYLVHVQCKEHQAAQARQRQIEKLPPSQRPKDYRPPTPPSKSILKKKSAPGPAAAPTTPETAAKTPRYDTATVGYSQDSNSSTSSAMPGQTMAYGQQAQQQSGVSGIGAIQLGGGLENILKQALSTVKNVVASQAAMSQATSIPAPVAAAIAASAAAKTVTSVHPSPSSASSPLFPSVQQSRQFEGHNAVFDSADARASARVKTPPRRSPSPRRRSPPRRYSPGRFSPARRRRSISPARRRSRSPIRNRSPLRNRSPPRRHSPLRNKSPPRDRGFSPPRRNLSPSRGRLPSPPRRNRSPGGRLPSPPRRGYSPSYGRLPSPPRRTHSPSRSRLPSPPRRRSPAGRLPSPPRARSPPRRLPSPPRYPSPGRRPRSPPRRNASPPRGRLPSPPRRSSPRSYHSRSPSRTSGRNHSPPRNTSRSRSDRDRSPRHRSGSRGRQMSREIDRRRGSGQMSPSRRSGSRTSTRRETIDKQVSSAIGSEVAKLGNRDPGAIENIVANVVKTFGTDKPEPTDKPSERKGGPSGRGRSRRMLGRRSGENLMDKDLEAVSDDEWDAWSGSVTSMADYENISSDDEDGSKSDKKRALKDSGGKSDGSNERKAMVGKSGEIIVKKDLKNEDRKKSKSPKTKVNTPPTPDSLNNSPSARRDRPKRDSLERARRLRRRRSSSLSSVSLDENEPPVEKPNITKTIENEDAQKPPGVVAAAAGDRSVEVGQKNLVVRVQTGQPAGPPGLTPAPGGPLETGPAPPPTAVVTSGKLLVGMSAETISAAYGCVMNSFAPQAVQNQTDVQIATQMLAELTEALVMVVKNEMTSEMRQKFTQTAMKFANSYPGHRLVHAFNLASSVTPEVMDFLTKQTPATLHRLTKVLQMRQDIVRTVLYNHLELQKLMLSLHTYPV